MLKPGRIVNNLLPDFPVALHATLLGTAEFFKNAQKIIILLSLERAKKAAFNSTLCVTVAYLAPEICNAKVTTFLVQRSMRNGNKNCDG